VPTATKGPTDWFAEEANPYERKPGIKSGPVALHWQMDGEDFVLAEREVLSPRTIAAPSGDGLAAHANPNSSQPRVNRNHLQAGQGIEEPGRRVFPDPDGEDHHRPARRYVPLGAEVPQERDCESPPSREEPEWNERTLVSGLSPSVKAKSSKNKGDGMNVGASEAVGFRELGTVSGVDRLQAECVFEASTS
jgi:hypothetical protein